MNAVASRRTAIYRLFNDDNVLLYVGITHDPSTRLKCHRGEKPWWPIVAYGSIGWLATRTGALAHEALAIAEERPLFNIKKPNPHHHELLANGIEQFTDGYIPATEAGISLRPHQGVPRVRTLSEVLLEAWARMPPLSKYRTA
jgi:predicted GIY-YIG superfamily endonuclease